MCRGMAWKGLKRTPRDHLEPIWTNKENSLRNSHTAPGLLPFALFLFLLYYYFCFFSFFIIFKFFQVISAPHMGLELPTPRSTVVCSSDGASRAPLHLLSFQNPQTWLLPRAGVVVVVDYYSVYGHTGVGWQDGPLRLLLRVLLSLHRLCTSLVFCFSGLNLTCSS